MEAAHLDFMKKLHMDVVHLDYLKMTNMEVVHLHAFVYLAKGWSILEQKYFKMIKMFKIFQNFQNDQNDQNFQNFPKFSKMLILMDGQEWSRAPPQLKTSTG